MTISLRFSFPEVKLAFTLEKENSSTFVGSRIAGIYCPVNYLLERFLHVAGISLYCDLPLRS